LHYFIVSAWFCKQYVTRVTLYIIINVALTR
jgi:hypothetical protein